MPAVTFYFDVGSPYAYLTAERIESLLGSCVAWQPILLGGLFKANGRSSWARSDRREAGMREIERRAREYGLPELRWPEGWPSDYLFAMRVATYAARAGRAREFAQSALRAAFAQATDLSDRDIVLAAAERAGLKREAAELAAGDPEVKQALRDATGEAHARGVIGVPSVEIIGRLFWGDDQLEPAAAALGGATG